MLTFKELSAIAEDVDCEPYLFYVWCQQCDDDPIDCHDETHNYFLQALLWRKDSVTGVDGWGGGNPIYVTRDRPIDATVKQFLFAALSYAEHEVRETFIYRGKTIFGPHVPLDRLWQIL